MSKEKQTINKDVESLDIQAALVGLEQSVQNSLSSMEAHELTEACSQIGYGLATVIDKECSDGRLDQEVRSLLGEVTSGIIGLRTTNFDPASTYLKTGVITGVIAGMAERNMEFHQEDAED